MGAQNLVAVLPPLYDLVCFHSQQSAEKYLKAQLQELGFRVPRTHNLEDLLDLLIPVDPTFKPLVRVAATLTRYAVDFRYPDDSATGRQAIAAIRRAGTIRRELRTRLGLRP